MLSAYKLLMMIIYVECIYVVVGEYICWVHICWWWNLLHAIGVVLLVKACIGIMLVWTCEICMEHVLLWSSPCSHTLLLLSFISNCCWMLRYSLCGLLWCVYKHQGRRPRRWKSWYHTYWSRLDTLHVLGRVVFVYELDVNMCWWNCVLDDCWVGILWLYVHWWEWLCSCLIMQDLINDACLIMFIVIMINVNLTPSGLGGPPTYLYEWVDGV